MKLVNGKVQSNRNENRSLTNFVVNLLVTEPNIDVNECIRRYVEEAKLEVPVEHLRNHLVKKVIPYLYRIPYDVKSEMLLYKTTRAHVSERVKSRLEIDAKIEIGGPPEAPYLAEFTLYPDEERKQKREFRIEQQKIEIARCVAAEEANREKREENQRKQREEEEKRRLELQNHYRQVEERRLNALNQERMQGAPHMIPQHPPHIRGPPQFRPFAGPLPPRPPGYHPGFHMGYPPPQMIRPIPMPMPAPPPVHNWGIPMQNLMPQPIPEVLNTLPNAPAPEPPRQVQQPADPPLPNPASFENEQAVPVVVPVVPLPVREIKVEPSFCFDDSMFVETGVQFDLKKPKEEPQSFPDSNANQLREPSNSTTAESSINGQSARSENRKRKIERVEPSDNSPEVVDQSSQQKVARWLANPSNVMEPHLENNDEDFENTENAIEHPNAPTESSARENESAQVNVAVEEEEIIQEPINEMKTYLNDLKTIIDRVNSPGIEDLKQRLDKAMEQLGDRSLPVTEEVVRSVMNTALAAIGH